MERSNLHFCQSASASDAGDVTPHRSGSPSRLGDRSIASSPPVSPLPPNRYTPTPRSTKASSFVFYGPQESRRRYFHSRRIQKGTTAKPWLENKDPREKWVTIIPLIGLGVGFIVVGLLIWNGLTSVVKHKYCPVLMEDFSSGILNDNVWTKEVQVGGYGSVLTRFKESRC